jgi:hypothetical protein
VSLPTQGECQAHKTKYRTTNAAPKMIIVAPSRLD